MSCPDEVAPSLSSTVMSLEWVKEKLGIPDALGVKVSAFGDHSGMFASLFRLKIVKKGDGAPCVFVCKTIVDKGQLQISARLGLSREGLFGSETAFQRNDTIRACAPVYLYARGNMESGEKLVIMEDLSEGIETGKWFGGSSYHNMKRSIEDVPSDVGLLEIVRKSVCVLAGIHAEFVCQRHLLLSFEWLNAVDWVCGKGRERWERDQETCREHWRTARGREELRDLWDDHLVACVEASLKKGEGEKGWEEFQRELGSLPWTLMHGDFHPGNVLFLRESGRDGRGGHVRILDWEMVGVGSGPEEVGQYMISHALPETRRGIEEEVLRAYLDEYNRKVEGKGERLSMEFVRREYVLGGSAKWVFFLCWMLRRLPLEPDCRFFHDQLKAFLRDHVEDPRMMVAPRV
uniref:Aminoglycoside phosphotransferase domain-containing protein n=1 Tax=Chromera velia CCMP2878 TaxID=1169474 RepID=A0A0G4IFR7_9ALVE|eukprot:Cvel_14058.t1-p1 / transcript=Cvel_14058.t1 / gene=Cvel_14058 / organism=Chromera_velia_CCMP2878 / gene_product=hypothetical protein / transcript_product=hypothetical protein / location=Cvel_scaffold986:20660-22010(-) / protein_length=403 / sequence_SO=supercontig / SO=protein_coding / is_pseudo=false